MQANSATAPSTYLRRGRRGPTCCLLRGKLSLAVTLALCWAAGTPLLLEPALAQTHRTSTPESHSSKPLTQAGLEKALRTGAMQSAEIVNIIRKRGVDFPLDHDTELQLRGAGADANIIEAVGQNYRGSGSTARASVKESSAPQAEPVPPPAATAAVSPSTPPAPPAPAFRDVAVPAGTLVPVQLTQTLDSGQTQPNQVFNGVLAQDLLVGNMVIVPRGAAVLGRVIDVKDAAHFAGSSRLTISLTDVMAGAGSSMLTVNATPVTKEGAGRGKSTAAKTGGGAAAGAVLGGIFGGAKGAAIGAAAGGGAGAGSSAVTKGQQVQFPSESVVQFSLLSPLLVRVSLSALPPAQNSPRQPLPR